MAFIQADSADTSFLLQIIGDLYEDGPWEDVLLSLRDAMRADEVILTLLLSAKRLEAPQTICRSLNRLSVSDRRISKVGRKFPFRRCGPRLVAVGQPWIVQRSRLSPRDFAGAGIARF